MFKQQVSYTLLLRNFQNIFVNVLITCFWSCNVQLWEFSNQLTLMPSGQVRLVLLAHQYFFNS